MQPEYRELEELRVGQVRVRCPICHEYVTMESETPVMPEHSEELDFLYAEGKGAIELPESLEILCPASGSKIIWRWLR